MTMDETVANITRLALNDPDPHAEAGVITLCAGCTRNGECRLGLEAETLEPDGRVSTQLMCDPSNEGGPGVAHGGWIAAALDEIVGHLVLHHRRMSVTKNLSVDFLRPVPINRPLSATARRVALKGDQWHVHAELTLTSTGVVLARAEAVMAERDRSHFERFRTWLANQDQSGDI